MVAELAERGHALVADSSELGQALGQWRMELVADLGGKDAVSSQQGVILDLAVRTKLMLDSIDAWLLTRTLPPSAAGRPASGARALPTGRGSCPFRETAAGPGRDQSRS